jgi:hypothetical protein
VGFLNFEICCSDVYVVEIAHQELMRHSENAPPVQVNLQGENARPVPRNITLFLKAHRPTRWQLISHGVDGKIVVIVSSFEKYRVTYFFNKIIQFLERSRG